MNINQFLKVGAITTGVVIASPITIFGQQEEKPVQLDKKLVEEFVNVSHGKIDKVKDMLGE